MDLTATGFTGPQVLTDVYLNTILFIRYGSFIPRIVIDEWGNKVRVIQDGMGNPFIDQYYTPPVVPLGIYNPFQALVAPRPLPPKVYVVGNKYMPVKLLKKDVRGDVWKALYFNKFLIPKWCVVKEGRKGMFPDNYGRDIRSKLTWQYQVAQSLTSSMPVPKTLDYFEDKATGHAYLVQAYIKGSKDLKNIVIQKLKATAWFAQPVAVQTEMLNYLLQAIKGILGLHQSHYIHRDITGTNFLVDKHKKVYLIDMELTWSIQDRLPAPPFGIGTPGYMSPEQEATQAPIIADDSYSMGALLILVLTSGLEPAMLVEESREILSRKLFFWTGNTDITSLIMQCLASPEERPSANSIYDAIKNYAVGLQKEPVKQFIPPITYDSLYLKQIIQQAIGSLATNLLAHENRWFSRVENGYGRDVYPLGDKHVFGSLYKGVGGVLYLLTRLQEAGFDTGILHEKIGAGLQFINSDIIPSIDHMVPSLYYGKAGLAVTLSEVINSGLISDTPYYRNVIRNCFLQPATGLDIMYGLAGQGLGALQCATYLEEDTLHDITSAYVATLIKAQQKDGSWAKPITTLKVNTTEKQTSFGYGIAGIIYFLLTYYEQYHDDLSLQAARKGLRYLAKQSEYTKGHYQWANSDKDATTSIWWCKGGPGIALSFLKAYSITKEPLYLDIAEKALLYHPKYLIYGNLSQCHGLSGLGEVYLEAYQITHNEEWKERAAWIANQLTNYNNHNKAGDVYWFTEQYNFPTADFMIGNSGIVHFLLRFSYPDRFEFPIIGS
ncbi:hypothetical protein F5148DRAFT_1353934 [Russula earlei]|uniref:Uncharacterized protein n=1 Tax=Russula earlei TaxID=71964 RepID=A0ACC0TTP6_9AGAM|nr:hypothetical protein F5148DRAFT_1353934 [Russula earlei]